MTDEKSIKGSDKRPGEHPPKETHPPRGRSSHSLNLKRIRFIKLLKDRYGYANEKAINEMERLLKEFAITNASFQIKRSRKILKPPLLE